MRVHTAWHTCGTRLRVMPQTRQAPKHTHVLHTHVLHTLVAPPVSPPPVYTHVRVHTPSLRH